MKQNSKANVSDKVNVNILRDCCWLVIGTSRWGNRKQGEVLALFGDGKGKDGGDDSAEAQADKADGLRRLSLSKKLIKCREYEVLCRYIDRAKYDAIAMCNESFYFNGLYVVKADVAERIEAQLQAAAKVMRESLIPDLIKAYPAAVEQSSKALKAIGQYNASDYPVVADLKEAFDIRWRWISFDVPNALPKEIREQQLAKMEADFAAAAEDITMTLYASLEGLVWSIGERLTPDKDGKAKRFEKSTIENLREFIATFNDRNIFNDAKLAGLVAKAKALVDGVDIDVLRDSDSMKKQIAAGMNNISKAVRDSIVEKPVRKFKLDED